jgi:hypothetical protein
MTNARDLKKLIRARMAKTGESYTAARAQLVGKALEVLPPNYEALAGHSDATLRERTGRGWPEWVRHLDECGATELGHRQTAKLLGAQQVDAWWAQAITVGYERLRGLRQVGQSCEGDFAASCSATMAGSAAAVRAAWEGKRRGAWLPVPLVARPTRSASSLRFDGPGGERIGIWLTEKAPDRCQVSVQVERLPSAAARENAKAAWRAHLASLKAYLGGS